VLANGRLDTMKPRSPVFIGFSPDFAPVFELLATMTLLRITDKFSVMESLGERLGPYVLPD